MKVNELRIGNYITAKGAANALENFLTVCGLEENSISTKYWSEEGKCWQKVRNKDNYIGIPLTEECLLNFGFIQDDIEFSRVNSRYNLLKTESYKGFLFSDRIKTLREIDYVHQLQNIYFAVANEELSLKKNQDSEVSLV